MYTFIIILYNGSITDTEHYPYDSALGLPQTHLVK